MNRGHRVLGNLWRTTGDINDTYAVMISHLDPNSTTAYAAGPGRWNDPDMLEVGRGGMTSNRAQAHFTMWCMMAAPLILGNNVTTMRRATAGHAHQSRSDHGGSGPGGRGGHEGRQLYQLRRDRTRSGARRWDTIFPPRPSRLLNRCGPATNVTCYWTNLGLQAGAATVRDLWAHADLGTFTNGFTAYGGLPIARCS